jgi:low temperature requirement protein LtrA
LASSVADRLIREPQDPRRVVYLELFFDLAFLLALTRLSRNLSAHLNGIGALHALILLGAIYWVWISTIWLADWYDPNHRIVQALIAWSMFGGLLMAAAVPQAFGPHALIFAGAYVGVHLGRGAVALVALRGHRLQQRSLRILLWFLATGVLWITGAAVRPAQIPLWTAAIVVDYAAPRAGWPVPRLGRSSREDVRATGSRLAERFQQVFLISLGELILLTGTTYSDSDLGWKATAAFVLVFVHAGLLAFIYYRPAGRQLGATIDTSEYPASVGQEAGYLHLVFIASVITSAVGDGRLIAGTGRVPTLSTTVATVTGTALFLLARIMLSVLTYGRLSLARLAGLIAIVALAPATARLPSVAVIAVIDAVLLITTAGDGLLERRARR